MSFLLDLLYRKGSEWDRGSYNPGMTGLLLMSILQKPAPDIDSLVASVLPTAAEEKWLSIPWRTNLTAARREAAREKKPIFVWMMNGHPLGCT